MKPSLPLVPKSSSSFALELLIAKPTRGQLRARLEVLAKKKMSVKRKTQASPEGCPLARGKILKVGVSSSPSSIVRPENFQFLEKGQNRNFDYKVVNFG